MIVDSALYRKGQRVEVDCFPHEFDKLRARGDRATATSSGSACTSPSEAELDDVAEAFGLHPLAVEDALKAHQRPKLERYDDSLFLVLKTLWYVDEEDAVETGEINLFVGHDFVITVRHGRGSELHSARAAARGATRRCSPTGRPRSSTPSATRSWTATPTWSRELEVDVDEIEASVFSASRTNDSTRIYMLKREIAEVRRAVLPLREPMRRFADGPVPGIDARGRRRSSATSLDHLNRAAETIDNLDSLLSTAFDAHLARISVQQNDDMRKISAGVAPGRRADADRRRLRHELRPHARAGLDARLPVRAAR